MPSDAEAEQADWEAFRRGTLAPRVRRHATVCSASVALDAYFPVVERWADSAAEAQAARDWERAYVLSVRAAAFVLEQLRATHPDWNAPKHARQCARMVRVLAARSLRRAEQCEVHLRNGLRMAREARARARAEARAQAEAQMKAEAEAAEAERLGLAAAPAWRDSLVMYVNGKRVEITPEQSVDPSMRLVDYLRDHLGLTGTKVGCGEGGCGACSVLLSVNAINANESEEDGCCGESTTPSHRVINACLRPLAACDGASITTVEGVGSQHDLHALQSRMAACNGSHCGFCTPGWVMNGFAMLMNDPTPSSVKQVQDRFDGNLCRCTGFRPILKAMSSFVPSAAERKDADATASHRGWRKHPEPAMAEYDPDAQRALAQAPLPSELQEQARGDALCMNRQPKPAAGRVPTSTTTTATTAPTWYAPTSLAALAALVGPLVAAATSFDLVLGGTTRGVKKYYNGEVVNAPSQPQDVSRWAGRPTAANQGHSVGTLISTEHVAELQALTIKPDGSIVAGSAVTLSQLIGALETTGSRDAGHRQLARHISRVANLQVRNVGGWAGNLALARQFPNFPSDVLTTMSAAGATLQLQRWTRPSLLSSSSSSSSLSSSSSSAAVAEAAAAAAAAAACSSSSSPASDAGASSDSSPQTLSLSVPAWVTEATRHHHRTGSAAAAAAAEEALDETNFDVLLNLTIPPTTAATALSSASSTTAPRISFSSFKLARRQQNAHALVNLAACLTIDPSTDKIATATVYLHADDAKVPRLVHACGTCDSLIGSVASSQATLTAALSALCKDLAAASGGGALPVQPYTAAAAQALLFKALLAAQAQGALPSDLVSAANWQLPRKVSTGSDVWYPPSASDEPLPAGQGMTKIRAPLQCTGQAKYATDFSAGTRRGLLHAAPIQSTRALATLSKFDPSIALSMPGVVDVVTADDIDVAGGAVNNCGADASDNGGNNSPEEIFVPLPTSASASASASDSVSSSSSPSPTTGGKVQFVGQTLAIVVALTQEQARAAARVMMDPTSGAVAYADCEGETPIFTIDDAIAANAFYEGSHCALVERLQPGVKSIDDALDASQHTWHGSLYFSGQRHFYMETQRAVVYPTEDDGLLVRSSTQGPTVVAKYVARATGLRMHNVEAKQVRAGGAFGGKLTRDLPVACAAAVAARKLGAPVSLVLDRVGDQQVTGGREPIRMDISVGFDADAGHSAAGSANASSPTVRAFKLALFMNGGWTLDGTFGDLDMGTQWSDNAYNVPNFHCESKAVRTNTPSTTSMRAPGVLHAVVAIETAFEHVAAALDIDVDDLRADHFYRVGDKTPYGQTIEYDSLPQCWSQVQAQSDYAAAQAACAAFNKANRWVKRAAALAPAKYGIGWDSTQSGCTVNVYGPDGSIVIQHGGCELGQGLNTKVAQAAASALGLDCSTTDLARLVRTDATSSRTVPNNGMTGGSSTSEVTCQAVMNACAVLVKRLAPYRDPPSKGGKGLSWEAACAAACGDRVQLSADGWFAPPAAVPGLDFSFRYFVYAAAVTVVELDVLTGQAQILRTDVVYDCGQSLNPVVDVGQIEGGFVMGIGTWLTEEASPGSDGGLLQNGTWEYKPPCSKDIPVVFNCTLLRDNPNVKGVLGSKATAEPPMILTNSVYFALRKCIAAARAANGMAAADARTFALAAPATAERVVAAIGTQPASDFRM